ncbi:MAG: hypothetical protein B7Y25_07295 [Alphaproteobacteria bacterium 16-39-46]|nr:MAG: hypothetical protein B7Y25_07295 [Alphaproteobacteria bacterium 16-39-46]OZA41763.1 MAG: hypothetical protein B7X84_07405 [Alphaproteobacteria bacterium 17-39-52]
MRYIFLFIKKILVDEKRFDSAPIRELLLLERRLPSFSILQFEEIFSSKLSFPRFFSNFRE